MITLPSPFLESLSKVHYASVRIEVLEHGRLLMTLPALSGSVSIDGTAQVRRRLSAELAAPVLSTDEQVREIVESLVSGTWRIRPVYVITLLDGRSWECPLGRFRAETASAKLQAGTLTVEGLDAMQAVVDDRFMSPRTISGLTKVEAIRQLLSESVPEYSLEVDSRIQDSTLWTTTFDESRADAVFEIARALGATVYALHDGGWRLQAVSELGPTSAPSWSVSWDDVVIAAETVATRENTYNAVRASGESPTGEDGEASQLPPPMAIVYDDDINSPTYWHGPFGHKPRFYSSSVMSTEEQCAAAAGSILTSCRGLTRSLSLETMTHPGLEPEDIIGVNAGHGSETLHIVDTVTIGLGYESMKIGTRLVRFG